MKVKNNSNYTFLNLFSFVSLFVSIYYFTQALFTTACVFIEGARLEINAFDYLSNNIGNLVFIHLIVGGLFFCLACVLQIIHQLKAEEKTIDIQKRFLLFWVIAFFSNALVLFFKVLGFLIALIKIILHIIMGIITFFIWFVEYGDEFEILVNSLPTYFDNLFVLLIGFIVGFIGFIIRCIKYFKYKKEMKKQSNIIDTKVSNYPNKQSQPIVVSSQTTNNVVTNKEINVPTKEINKEIKTEELKEQIIEK